jgi:hypothetical protein
MKPNAFSRYKYSGSFYNFVVEEIGEDINIKYFYSGEIFLSADLDDNQRITFKTQEPLPIGSVVSKIKDSNGVLILDDLSWQISTLSPVLNTFNTLE